MCLHKLTHLLVLFVLLEGLVRKRKADTANVLELRDNLKSQVHGAPPPFIPCLVLSVTHNPL